MPCRLPFRLPPIAQAALWTMLSAVAGGLMNVVIRHQAETLHPLEIVFFRNLFSLACMAPLLLRIGMGGAVHGANVGLFLLRAGVAFVSMVTWFVGISLVPLSTATALNFTAPLFATVGAALILRETVRARRWTAVAIGLAGMAVILRPFGSIDANLLVILLSAATAAMGSITVKFLSRTESSGTIVAYMVLYLTPMSLVPALFVWRWPTGCELAALLLLGLLGTATHLTAARALAVADASAVAPFGFLRLPYSAFLGYVFFGEPTDAWTWCGAAFIAGSSLYVAHREARLARSNEATVRGGRPWPVPQK